MTTEKQIAYGADLKAKAIGWMANTESAMLTKCAPIMAPAIKDGLAAIRANSDALVWIERRGKLQLADWIAQEVGDRIATLMPQVAAKPGAREQLRTRLLGMIDLGGAR